MVETKEADMGTKARKPTAGATGEEPAVHEGAELPERWSVQRKTELVLRLLRGQALDAVSRESQIPAHELRRLEARVSRSRESRVRVPDGSPFIPEGSARSCSGPPHGPRGG